jgi:RNA polymerase-binding transcription factor DksA
MPTKKAAPAKKTTPAKAAKPVVKAPVKKAAPVKAAKLVTKPVAKPATKAPAKKTAPVKAAKPVTKPVAKPAAKAPAKKVAPVKAAKPVTKPVAKPATKAPAKKAAPVKAAKPVAKPVAKPAAKAPTKKAAPAKAEKPVVIVEKKADKKTPKEPKVKVSEKKIIKLPAKKVPQRAESASKALQISAKQTTPIPTKIPVALVQRPVKTEPVKDVKIPKINTKTSVPYNPGYVAMEKRVDSPKPVKPMARYSDADLQEFKELIYKKLEAAKKELVFYQGQVSRKDSSDNEGARYMTMEDGSISMEREQLSQMASRTVTYIDHLEKALMRIENKTYGICRETGNLIDKARLRAVPHATLSLEAKLGLVKKPISE